MANEPTIQITGNVTGDPELKFTGSGAAMCNFTVAATPRNKVGDQYQDGEAMFFRCAVWRDHAENVAATVTKGMRVNVLGRFKTRAYQTNDGADRLSLEVEVDEVGPSLRFATAQVQRAGQQRQQSGGWGQPKQQPNNDPWAMPGTHPTDEPPF